MNADKKSAKDKDRYVRTVRKYRLKSPRSILKTTKKYH
jgi:hypothetical protein